MMKINPKYTLLALILVSSLAAAGQTITIQLGPDEIGENQYWTIGVTLQNGQLKTYDNFPDIEGLRKRGTSTQQQTSIVNGQMSSSTGVIMTYQPIRQGTIVVAPFQMKINDQVVKSPGKKIKVGPAAQQQSRDPFRQDPFRDFFGKEETEFVDIKEDALLALSTSKDEVYVGEGLSTTLSFLVADNNRAPMQFHELGRQLSDILKKLKPANCWEENFNIENIEGVPITINGKGYTQYKIYQATYYPLNAEPIRFPSVGLEMIKFKVAKNPSFFGQNRQEDFKTFYSKAKTIPVRELPPHPLQSSVAVGTYQLDERISAERANTGQSLEYEFNVYGEGNISSIQRPVISKDDNFDFYEPNVQQNITRENSRVTGTKSFKYFLVPKEPGQFEMGQYFQWIYFNTNKRTYDTLRSKLTLAVEGESQRNQAIQSTDLGSFYDRVNVADNTLHATAQIGWMKWGMNSLMALMLAGAVWLVFSARPKG